MTKNSKYGNLLNTITCICLSKFSICTLIRQIVTINMSRNQPLYNNFVQVVCHKSHTANRLLTLIIGFNNRSCISSYPWDMAKLISIYNLMFTALRLDLKHIHISPYHN